MLDRTTLQLIDIQGDDTSTNYFAIVTELHAFDTGLAIPNDLGVGDTRGFTITAAFDPSANGGAQSLALIAASASKNTANGVADFDLILNKVPKVSLVSCRVMFSVMPCYA